MSSMQKKSSLFRNIAITIGIILLSTLLSISYIKNNPYDYFKGISPEGIDQIISNEYSCKNIKVKFNTYNLECVSVHGNVNNINLLKFKGNKEVLIKTITDIIKKKNTVFTYKCPSSKYVYINILKKKDYFVVIYSNDNKTYRLIKEAIGIKK